MFNGTLFPAMIGFAEIGLSTKHLIAQHMLNVFSTIVVGDTFPQVLWMPNGYCKGNVHNDPLLEDLWCWELTLCTRFFWGNTKGKWRYVFFGMPVYLVYVGLDNSLTLWGKSIIDKISTTPERYPIYFKTFIPLPEERWVKGLTGVQVTGKKWGQLHFRYLDEAHEKYLASLVEGGRIQEQQAHPIISARHYEDSGIELKPNIRVILENIALKGGREVKELIREAVARLIRDREL